MTEMRIERAERQGDELRLSVSGLHPTEDEPHLVIIALPLLVERRLRELVPACADLGTSTVIHTVAAEDTSKPDYWLDRLRNAHIAEGCEDDDCHLTSNCMCAECGCCWAAIEIILHEHFARLNPDQLERLPAVRAERLVRIGGVPGKTFCGDCGAIEDLDHHTPPAEPIQLGALLNRTI